MPKTTICTDVFTFDMLSDKAKEKARDWWREGGLDYEWWNFATTEWEQTTLPEQGFPNAEISFSGFWSQGDGASFTSGFDFAKYCESHGVTIRPMIQRLIDNGMIVISGEFSRSSHHYSHENTVTFDYEIWINGDYPNIEASLESILKNVKEDGRVLMRKIYRELEQEYDHLNSNEQVDEAIIANEYTFTEDGKRFG